MNLDLPALEALAWLLAESRTVEELGAQTLEWGRLRFSSLRFRFMALGSVPNLSESPFLHL